MELVAEWRDQKQQFNLTMIKHFAIKHFAIIIFCYNKIKSKGYYTEVEGSLYFTESYHSKEARLTSFHLGITQYNNSTQGYIFA